MHASLAPRSSRVTTLAAAGLMTSITLAGCASSPPATSQPTTPSVVPARTVWPIKTREHVDLWLHGFGLLQDDSGTKIPLFARGYRDAMTVYKNRANVITQLDANVDKLRGQLAANPRMADAQFAALYFTSMDEMRAVIDKFIANNGNPRAAESPREAMGFAVLGTYFGTRQDQAWLSLFASSLWDESAKYYHSYWTQQQRERGPVIDSVQGMWEHLMRPRIQRFLNHTQQSTGDIILALPLGGEGRTISASGDQRMTIAVDFPGRESDAAQALYVIAHEVVAPAVNAVVSDNITPAQERAGMGTQLRLQGAVRGGLMLCERLVPELADGYARYYITAAGEKPGANPRAQLTALFPIPDGMRDMLVKQIDTVQGGI